MKALTTIFALASGGIFIFICAYLGQPTNGLDALECKSDPNPISATGQRELGQ